MLHLKTRRFDLVEVLLVAALVGVTTFKLHPTIASQPSVELVDLERQYGPSKDSEHAEEWAIRDFFGNRRDGVFLDIGANHYRRFSNTYYLETVLGWSGIAVEPLKSFEADYVKFRPRTKFRPFFVSNVSNEQARMYLLAQNTLVTS